MRRFKDPESGKTLVFITNNFSLPAAMRALRQSRWRGMSPSASSESWPTNRNAKRLDPNYPFGHLGAFQITIQRDIDNHFGATVGDERRVSHKLQCIAQSLFSPQQNFLSCDFAAVPKRLSKLPRHIGPL